MVLPAVETTASANRPRAIRTPRQRGLAWVLMVVALPLTVLFIQHGTGRLSLSSALLVLLLEVVGIAALGGFLVATVAAVAAVLLTNWYLVPPYRTLIVTSLDDTVALVVFVAVALSASLLVDRVSHERLVADRAGTEAKALLETVQTPADEADPARVLDRIRIDFAMERVQLVDPHGRVVAQAGADTWEAIVLDVEVGQGFRVVCRGRPSFGQDPRLLFSLSTAALRAYEARVLTADSARADELAAADRAKSALLATVSHDLRTPLAAIKVAADALAQDDVAWTEDDRRELLDGILSSVDRLDSLVSNLLDMSRIEAGAVAVTLTRAALDGVAAGALLGLPQERVDVELPEDLPLAVCDPTLLERVLANLLANALAHAPQGTRVSVTGRSFGSSVEVSVVDHGPGVPPDLRAVMFDAFQRLGDRSPGGAGLGLAIALAFTKAMGGTLTPTETPGGGLTMTVTLAAE